MFKGGLAGNIVPPEFKATFDVRITPRTSKDQFEKTLMSWIDEAEGDDKDSGRITYDIHCVIASQYNLAYKFHNLSWIFF